MENEPLVSVIIPTYNRAQKVPKAIQSILNQTYKKIDIIVVDDCSQDETNSVLIKLQKKDDRLSYFRNEANCGVAKSRNLGVSMAKGSYLLFLDDDDMFLPERIENQLNLCIANPEYDILISGVNKRIPETDFESKWIDYEFAPNLLFHPNNFMCKKKIFEKVKFRSNYMEWRDLAFQIFYDGYKVFSCDESFSIRNRSKKSLSNDSYSMLNAALIFAKLYYKETRETPAAKIFESYLARCFKNCGNYELKKMRFSKAAVHYFNSFLVNKDVKNFIPFV